MKSGRSLRLLEAARAGFTMIEVMVAVVLLNLLVVGVVKLFIGQNAMVEDLEGWAEGEPVLYLVPDRDPLARQLGMPANLSSDRPALISGGGGDTPYLLEIAEVQRLPESDAVVVSLTQVENKDQEGEDEGKKNGRGGKR